MRRLFLFVTVLAFLAVIAIVGGNYYLNQQFEARGPLSSETLVTLPRGAGLSRVADALESAGAISDTRIFKIGARMRGAETSLKAGEYALPAGASMSAILDQLVEGKTFERRITFAEGLTSAEIMAALNSAEELSGPMLETRPPEGSLAPDTYFYASSATRQSLIDQMQSAQHRILDELWAGRAVDLPIASKEEALILASIVEKETGIAGERAEVAGVFINRLRKRMRLQSDPTVIYGITGGLRDLDGPIRRSHLRDKNAFNTYVIRGLPPTPIANPGREAIAAVLNPAQTSALYFVADGTGGHVFADTLRQHNRNVAAWRKIERSRNSE